METWISFASYDMGGQRTLVLKKISGGEAVGQLNS